MICVWAVPSTSPPSSPPRAVAASPLNAREPEPEPRLALRLPQHRGPPQSPHVTSEQPIRAAPAHIKGAGLPAGHASRLLPQRHGQSLGGWDWDPGRKGRDAVQSSGGAWVGHPLQRPRVSREVPALSPASAGAVDFLNCF